MRVALSVQSWPGTDGPREALEVARAAWNDVSDAQVLAVAVGDGGPRSADAFEGPRSSVGGAEAVATDAGTMLAPRAGAHRWSPVDLSAALLGLASDPPPAGIVIVPLGDASPAGDAHDLWGGALGAARTALAPLSVRALVGSDRPLLGFHGMSAAVRDGREHDQALAIAAQEQEERWRVIAAEGDPIASRGALLGPSRLSDAPGSGAAGGLAYCLAALGAQLTPAADYLADAAGLGDIAAGADVVVAVVPTLTPSDVDHSLAASAARIAARHAVPAVAIAPEVAVGRRDLMALGISGAHEGAFGVDGLADVVRRVARTWTPRR